MAAYYFRTHVSNKSHKLYYYQLSPRYLEIFNWHQNNLWAVHCFELASSDHFEAGYVGEKKIRNTRELPLFVKVKYIKNKVNSYIATCFFNNFLEFIIYFLCVHTTLTPNGASNNGLKLAVIPVPTFLLSIL